MKNSVLGLMLNEALLNEAKELILAEDPEKASSEIAKVKSFKMFIGTNRVSPGKIIICDYANLSNKHFCIKPKDAHPYDPAESTWLITYYDLIDMFENATGLADLYILYTTFKVAGLSRINGVTQSNIVFYAGPWGELFNSRKEATQMSRIHKIPGRTLKPCQFKDIERLCKENEEKHYSWNTIGLKFLPRK